MNPPLSLENHVCALIVTYNPDPAFLDNIAAISSQVCHIVVVDNGSTSETQQHLMTLEACQNCTVIRNYRNLGIAVALNRGVKYAIEAGFNWIATFDQDSRVSDGFIRQMVETYQQARHPEKVAIIAPTYVDRESGVPQPIMRAGNGECLAVMTSGNMLPSSVVQIVGTFNESLYMDYVDIEFCLRARQKGMVIIQSPAVLLHSCGRLTRYRFLGRCFGASNHSAERRYYITRNRLRLLRPYAADQSWFWREIKMIFAEAAKIALVEDNKWKKFRAMAAGTADALRGRAGKKVEL